MNTTLSPAFPGTAPRREKHLLRAAACAQRAEAYEMEAIAKQRAKDPGLRERGELCATLAESARSDAARHLRIVTDLTDYTDTLDRAEAPWVGRLLRLAEEAERNSMTPGQVSSFISGGGKRNRLAA